MATAYEWDSNCSIIYENLKNIFNHILAQTGQLEHNDHPENINDILNYYKKWHYNNELYKQTIFEISSRRETLNELLEQGYGVSIELSDALENMLNREGQWCNDALAYTFSLHIDKVKQIIYLPQSQITKKNSGYVISQLCLKLNLNENENIPLSPNEKSDISGYLNSFFHLSRVTPASATIATLLKMFLSMTEASDTIMSGFIGENNIDPPQQIKLIASSNIRDLFYHLYNNMDDIGFINLSFIKELHYRLTKGLDSSHSWQAGTIRNEDFFNKNGLTFEYGNFHRGISELDYFLNCTDWSTESFEEFINQLVYLYYLLISIHPFIDSNGRTARSLVNFLMLRRGLVPIIFSTPVEIWALPRYGGSVLKMKEYFENRIKYSVSFYFEEMNRMAHLGLTDMTFFNIDFDSGFYFRQIQGHFSAIEITFKIYETDPEKSGYEYYAERSLITASSSDDFKNIRLHCGFTQELHGEWLLVADFSIDYITFKEQDHNRVNVWDATIIIPIDDLPENVYGFEAVVLSGDTVFNNKGLNYNYILNR